MGYSPEIVLAGRRINDDMSKWLAEQLILEMAKRNISILNSSILVLGFTFKENCPDIRNTKVFDFIKILKEYNLNIEIVDPWVNPEEAKKVYELNINKKISKSVKFNAVVCIVAHKEFTNMNKSDWENILDQKGFIFDLKGIVPRELSPIRI